jgi:hypothetical protein
MALILPEKAPRESQTASNLSQSHYCKRIYNLDAFAVRANGVNKRLLREGRRPNDRRIAPQLR